MRAAGPMLFMILSVGVATTAVAQDEHGDDPASLLAAGRQALLANEPAKAWRMFELGLSVAEDGPQRWPMLLGLALAYEMDDAPLDAVQAYRRFLHETEGHPEAHEGKWRRRRDQALDDVQRLELILLTTFSKVAVVSDPPGAQLVLDGEPTSLRSPAVIYVRPGHHQLDWELEGHERATVEFDVALGERPHFEPALPLTVATVQPSALPLPTPPEPSARPAPRRALPGGAGSPQWLPTSVPPASAEPAPSLMLPGVVTLSVGGAFLIGAGVLHGLALSAASELEGLAPTDANAARDGELREQIYGYQGAYVTAYVAGGIGVAAGLSMVLWHVIAGENAPAVSAFVGPRGGGLVGVF